jgi:sialate O-acetylesterase
MNSTFKKLLMKKFIAFLKILLFVISLGHLLFPLQVYSEERDGGSLKLDSLFTSQMVLPRRNGNVSGLAGPNELVTVAFGGISQSAKSDDKGRFTVPLADLKAGTTGSLVVTSSTGNKQVLEDVIAGDVFLCSGQSNMALPVDRALNSDIVKANAYNETIRMVTVSVNASPVSLKNYKTAVTWEKATPDKVGHWSATCYFFAEALQKRVSVPIGLVNASVGGSNITTWMSLDALGGTQSGAEQLLKVYADDPIKAGIEFGHSFETWWSKSGGPGKPWSKKPSEVLAWQPVPQPITNWEKWGTGLEAYDGPLWYGAVLTLNKKQASQAATLDLGLIDDIDQTWLNGQPVGFSSGGNVERQYAIAPGSLKVGENVIVINVIDLWSFGGLYGDMPRELVLADGTHLPLDAWYWLGVPANQKYPPRAPWDTTGGVSILKNGMIDPMGRFPFTAVIWYQGESNVGGPYKDLLGSLFKDWRNQFGPDLPFAVVQLANNGSRPTSPTNSAWARLREDQRLAVNGDAHATLAVAIDIGEPSDVHPANKQALGDRLARAISVKVYGVPGSESGPEIETIERTGDSLLLSFKGAEGNLVAYSASRPIGFEVCYENACQFAEAELSGRQVILAAVGSADRVRFCWADAPTCTLYDGTTGLPAVPFEKYVTD